MSEKKYGLGTLAVHAGQESPDPATGSRAVPIYQTVILRLQEHRARGKPVCPEGVGQHLHPHHESHQ